MTTLIMKAASPYKSVQTSGNGIFKNVIVAANVTTSMLLSILWCLVTAAVSYLLFAQWFAVAQTLLLIASIVSLYAAAFSQPTSLPTHHSQNINYEA